MECYLQKYQRKYHAPARRFVLKLLSLLMFHIRGPNVLHRFVMQQWIQCNIYNSIGTKKVSVEFMKFEEVQTQVTLLTRLKNANITFNERRTNTFHLNHWKIELTEKPMQLKFHLPETLQRSDYIWFVVPEIAMIFGLYLAKLKTLSRYLIVLSSASILTHLEV